MLAIPHNRRWISIVCGLLVSTVLAADEPRAAKPEIRTITGPENQPVAFEAAGLPSAELADVARSADAGERFARLFAVYVASGREQPDVPPIIGKYSVHGSALRFIPRFPLSPGLTYRVLLRPAELKPGSDPKLPPSDQENIVREVQIPAAIGGEPTEITAVYPSAATIPENNLRFYIHFSNSMARGEAYEHIRLLDSTGAAVEEPFLEIGEELWDPRARRFTLLIEPGRIKLGVRPREELGPVLEAGKEYTLVLSRQWRDAAGRQLKQHFTKRFRAGPPVEKAIDQTAWKVTAPAAMTSAPVAIRFPEPLDHALLQRTIRVMAANGAAIHGRVAVSNEERLWEFSPDASWRPGKYDLVVDTALEDLAGNRIGHRFEVDKLDSIEKQIDVDTVRIPFTVESSPTAAER